MHVHTQTHKPHAWLRARALTHLFEIECDGDPVILLAVTNAWTLPPAVAAVNSVRDWMM